MGQRGHRTKRRVQGAQSALLLRLPKRMHHELKVFAATQRQSLNGLIVSVLEEWWDVHPVRGQIASMVHPEVPPAKTGPKAESTKKKKSRGQ